MTDMSELSKAFIMRDIEVNVMPSKRGELERASATWANVIKRKELKFQ